METISFLILAVTSIVFSREMFLFFNDPEGQNLFVVAGMSAIIYYASLAVYTFSSLPYAGLKKIFLVIVIQILLVIDFYFCLT